MKKTSILKFFFFMVMALPIMVACGGDDGDDGGNSNGNGGNGGSSGSRVIKVTESGTSSIFEDEITYDQQGRVVKIVGKKNGNVDMEEEYIYSETLIILNRKNISDGSTTSTRTTKYHLQNGRIVSEDHSSETFTYTYDSDGYCSSRDEEYASPRQFVWQNGNLVKVGDRTLEYGSLAWCNPIFFSLKGTNFDVVLQMAGYYGKMPKNMPTKYISSSGSETTYEYSTSGGKITSVTSKKGDDLDVISFVWN